LAFRHQSAGSLDEAEAVYRQILTEHPRHAHALHLLGALSLQRGKPQIALPLIQQAIEQNDQFADYHNSLGLALISLKRPQEAIDAFKTALELRPDYEPARENLARAMKAVGRRHYRSAVAADPHSSRAHDDLVYSLYFNPDYDEEKIFQELMRWEQRHAQPLRGSILPHRNDRNPDRRLKIGYVSPDFYGQAECFFVVPLMESHGHKQFEIHCYSSVPQPDGVTAHLRECADVWHDVGSLSDEALAEQIRRDQIDILVDLTMHMARSRLLVFARKPAPVQVTWLAYPGTTGLGTVDYRLTDAHFDPPGRASWYSEESYRLPDCWCCFGPLGFSQPVKADRGGPICFGSLNSPRKLNEPILRLWAKVLHGVEGSRLFVLSTEQDQRQLIVRIFGEEGISPNRIAFTESRVRLEYLRLYDLIDIVLDTLPYNGITTTCDAMWMGVPVVSLVGNTAAGRAGLSLLSTVGLAELVGNDPARFVEIAVELALDRPRLIELRAGLRQRMESSPLMDAKKFTRNMESAYRWMWQRWCEKPAVAPSPAGPNDAAIEIDQKLDAYRQVMEADPTNFVARSNWVMQMQYHPNFDATAILAEAKRWNELHARPLAGSIKPHANDRSPERRLRIGFVSGDFRNHVVGRNVFPLFREHDRQSFEFFCYSNAQDHDDYTLRFQALADGWRDICEVPDDAVAQIIHDDRIDILVDLSLHSAQNRLLVFARKPAPVQATFAGYPGTTGLEAIDYRLTDPYLDPPGQDAFYSERSIRLPHSFWCYDPSAMEVDEYAVAPLPARRNGYVTFGCLNNFPKVNFPVVQLWAEVLAARTDSRLLMLVPEGEFRRRLLERFERLGIAPARIQFVDRQSRADYLRTYDRIDLGLDTIPYNGHTTSLDSLWMGVPVVTLAGRSAVGRAGLSQLSNLGLEQLVARTPEQFVRIAVGMAGDVSRLAELRQNLRERMRQSPLTDARGFTRAIEASLRQMWRAWCADV
jgi:predicted O-linked N-acetylglucosamine transferase (SPINDLY family)